MRRPLSSAGFTLLELLIVTSLIAITSGVGMSLLSSWLPNARADAAMRLISFQLVAAREQALSERRNIEVIAVGDDQLQIVRHELPIGETILRTVPLEYNVKFHVFSSLPDTPDLFGHSAAVDFDAAALTMFTSDGSMIDENGIPVNGTIFLGFPENTQSARSVTVFGGTGRVRGYRWTGNNWKQ